MAKRAGMGEVYAQVTLKGPRGVRRLRLLVDTGSTYTWLRTSLLREIGVKPVAEDAFETIEGQDAYRPIGEAVIEYEGDARTTVVVFAGEREAQVLGLHALEGLGLEVDPRGRRLRRRARLLALRSGPVGFFSRGRFRRWVQA